MRLCMLLKIIFQPVKVHHTCYPYFPRFHTGLFHTTTPTWMKVMAYHLELQIIVCASNCIIVSAPMCVSIPICISSQSQVFLSRNAHIQAENLSMALNIRHTIHVVQASHM